ncbi:MAG: RCC1 domain-containing protein, partial [Bdellovibrionales bacterium]
MRIHAGNPIPKRNFILFACALIAAPVLFSGCLESGKIDVSSSKNFDRQGLSISAEDVLVGGLSKISVSINYIPPHDVTLHLKTQTVDATEGYDYQPLDLDLTIPAGTTHAEIPLVTFQQNQIPGDHHLKIVASNVSGADVLDSEAPITIQERKFSKIVTGATLLSAGLSHICAKLSDKKVYCWGSNGDGQVTGDGVASNTGFSKTLIAGLPQDPIRISAHAYNSCALYANGDVLCWGYNGYGNIEQPANAHVVDTPWGSILPAGKTAIDVYNSGYHTCVVYTDGTVGCQGQGGYGALGYGSFVDIRTLQTVTTLPGPATTVAATYYNTCAALSTGAVWCWGDNTYGENGTGVIGGSTNVANASLLTAGVVALTSGFAHHCALLSDGTVKCWGYNLQSQLGFSGANSATPTQVTLPRPAVQVSAAGNSTCALLDTGEMYCWGANYFGSLGDGTSLGQVSPVKVKGFSDAVQSISKGVDRTCAILKTDGRPMCWGGNDRLNAIAGGQEPKAPTDFPGVIGQKVKDVMMAQSWTSNLNGSVLQVGCVVLDNGATQCSGDNSYRALGIGGVGVALYSGDPRITLTQASGLGAGTTLALSTGRNFTCALLANTGVKCWGDNSLDQIGNNSVFTVAGFKVDPGATPTGLTTGVAQVSSFGNFSCAVMADASVQCWGYSDTGKSGTCATASSKNPVTIAGLS